MRIFNSLIVAGFVVFFSYLISHAINDTPKKREAAIEEAIRSGHRVIAVLKKIRSTTMTLPGTHNFWSCIGYYEYEYKGKSYKYKYWADNPPDTLTLYFISNPARAQVAGALSPVTTNWPLVYVIAAVAVYVLIF